MSRFIPNKELLKLIDDWAILHGMKQARETCQYFILRKTSAGVLPTARKTIPRSWKEKAWKRQHYRCAGCKKELLLSEVEGDHRIPLILGGEHSQRNIDAMCEKCNRRKGANDPIQESKASGRGILEQISHSLNDDPLEDE